MAQTTSKLGLIKPEQVDGINNTLVDVGTSFDIIDDKLMQLSEVQALLDIRDTRMDNIESASKYFWIEEHTLAEGENTITLTHSYTAGQKLFIKDMNYGTEWFSPKNWTIDGQVITFPVNVDPLTFRIVNMG